MAESGPKNETKFSFNRKVEERIVIQRAVETLGSQPLMHLASEG